MRRERELKIVLVVCGIVVLQRELFRRRCFSHESLRYQ
jgi:hypothetical protein